MSSSTPGRNTMAHANPLSKVDYLIVHPKFGVYLGSAQGRGYWSKVDSVGQPAAVTFPSQQEAHAYMASWAVSAPAGVKLLPVVSDGPGYATIAACVRAGAPAWLDPLTPTANGRAQAL